MAVPDKRFTIDVDRPVTTTRSGRLVLTRGIGKIAAGCRANGWHSWATLQKRKSSRARKLLKERYSIHFNVWTLAALLDFVAQSQRDFKLPFTLEWVVCSEN